MSIFSAQHAHIVAYFEQLEKVEYFSQLNTTARSKSEPCHPGKMESKSDKGAASSSQEQEGRSRRNSRSESDREENIKEEIESSYDDDSEDYATLTGAIPKRRPAVPKPEEVGLSGPKLKGNIQNVKNPDFMLTRDGYLENMGASTSSGYNNRIIEEQRILLENAQLNNISFEEETYAEIGKLPTRKTFKFINFEADRPDGANIYSLTKEEENEHRSLQAKIAQNEELTQDQVKRLAFLEELEKREYKHHIQKMMKKGEDLATERNQLNTDLYRSRLDNFEKTVHLQNAKDTMRDLYKTRDCPPKIKGPVMHIPGRNVDKEKEMEKSWQWYHKEKEYPSFIGDDYDDALSVSSKDFAARRTSYDNFNDHKKFAYVEPLRPRENKGNQEDFSSLLNEILILSTDTEMGQDEKNRELFRLNQKLKNQQLINLYDKSVRKELENMPITVAKKQANLNFDPDAILKGIVVPEVGLGAVPNKNGQAMLKSYWDGRYFNDEKDNNIPIRDVVKNHSDIARACGANQDLQYGLMRKIHNKQGSLARMINSFAEADADLEDLYKAMLETFEEKPDRTVCVNKLIKLVTTPNDKPITEIINRIQEYATDAQVGINGKEKQIGIVTMATNYLEVYLKQNYPEQLIKEIMDQHKNTMRQQHIPSTELNYLHCLNSTLRHKLMHVPKKSSRISNKATRNPLLEKQALKRKVLEKLRSRNRERERQIHRVSALESKEPENEDTEEFDSELDELLFAEANQENLWMDDSTTGDEEDKLWQDLIDELEEPGQNVCSNLRAKPGQEKGKDGRCHLCGQPEHFWKNCGVLPGLEPVMNYTCMRCKNHHPEFPRRQGEYYCPVVEFLRWKALHLPNQAKGRGGQK